MTTEKTNATPVEDGPDCRAPGADAGGADRARDLDGDVMRDEILRLRSDVETLTDALSGLIPATEIICEHWLATVQTYEPGWMRDVYHSLAIARSALPKTEGE